MRRFLSLSLLFVSVVTNAGLVETYSSTHYRDSNSPAAEYAEVRLDNAGEIRISNVNLQDGAMEPSSSTEILLDGLAFMRPFHLPAGGSSVFPVPPGVHQLEITIRGKPGGGVRVSFFEERPDVSSQKGWDLLDDGTVIHKNTGLNWHRVVGSPGLAGYERLNIRPDVVSGIKGGLSISEYINRLNSGVYGTDPITGNAGHTDWRAPTMEELLSAIDLRTTAPPISDKFGEVAISYEKQDGWIRGAAGGGMKLGDPLYICSNNWVGYYDFPDCSDDDWHVDQLITNDRHPWGYMEPDMDVRGWFSVGMDNSSGTDRWYWDFGSVWPVRGSPTK